MPVEASLTCPECRHVTREMMPDDACVFFFECPQCKTLLRPRAGECCVFCSYGDHKCPPQMASLELKRAKG